MDLAKNNEHEAIVNGVADVARRFGDDSWLQRDDGLFPTEFHRAMADGGIASVTCAAGGHGHEIAPITEQLIMCFIAEKVLDQPKSYC